MESYQHILVVLPHPDDEGIVAGTLAAYIAQGARVTYICLTLGEMGRNMGTPHFANRVSLPSIRKQELVEACRNIGIQDLRMWGLHDKTVEFEDQERLDERLLATIEELGPELIITFYPGYSVHPDHDATGAAVVRTVARIAADTRPIVQCIALSKGCKEIIGQPDITNDVSQYMSQKQAAIRSHRSQFHHLVGDSFDKPEKLARFTRERLWTYKLC
ncbi:bacillithiol biosynthesis deacetylase BshB2 [Paenibacillus sp. UMB4589-SE434]|uniref:bacillithiol biosynthesis deacetylase BshB2 n=1 Tax=Paenibacillus sp. UMB4589-SE434 TaxID=3046314 RepID=UPI00254AB47B|nr:bacillithiol biosynthesis deacetylase BshB2 [Paenibacillus sp. UMB4589-SE434]MDK8183834.1 bacillithiol biosynthesis deacetylase BshB2 [Paenibacillus sp. UMB4589-SE434]